MNYQKFDLISLQLFLAASHLGSFSAAAKAVHLVPSAASRRLTEMEEEIGVKLFHRRSNGVTLTPSGIVVQRQFTGIIAGYDKMWLEFGDLSSGVRGQIRVWATSSSLSHRLSELLKSFLDQHKDIRVELEERTDLEVVSALGEGAADVGFFSSQQHCPQLEKLKFAEDRMVLVAPKEHPLSKRRRVGFAEVAQYDFIGWDDGVALGTVLQASSSSVGVPLRVRLRVRSLGALCSLIKTGLGLGVAPFPHVLGEATRFDLRTVELTDDWAARAVLLGFRNRSALSPASKLFVEHMAAKNEPA